MSKDPLAQISSRHSTPATEKAREDQVLNNTAGYVFQVSDMTRLERFLMLGTDGGTYYVTEAEYTKENAKFLIDLIGVKGTEVVAKIVEISEAGRAARQNPTLFALAAASVYGDDPGRSAAYKALPRVARTASMLFQFITYREQLGGWSRGLRTAVGEWWYNAKDINKLAYQMVKYRTRNDWTHRDILRMSHPKAGSEDKNVLYAWAVGKDKAPAEALPAIIHAFEHLQRTTSVGEVVALINNNSGITWEMIPDKFINEPQVWEALIQAGVPQTALIRQLPRLTRMGMFDDFTNNTTHIVVNQLMNEEHLQKARVHPINVLIAQKTYAQGQGVRSNWTPSAAISNALDGAFYKAFKAVEPTEKRIMLAVDVSGSMGSAIPGRNYGNGLGITCRDAAAAIAMVTQATEPKSQIYGFSDGTSAHGGFGRWSEDLLTPLDISSRRRLDDVVRYMQGLNFGATNQSLPMQYAAQRKLPVDAFVIYTDNEFNTGNVHPYQALKRYRDIMGIDAKLIVVGLTATKFSIADPLDTGMLDVVGFDASIPGMINEFIRD